jgi:hypothetical protein
MSTVEPSSPPASPRPKWKDPFVVAFILGIIILTALPFLQRRFLNAPPPIRDLPPWELSALDDGGPLGSAGLAGKVLLMELVPVPCEAECVERQAQFSTGVQHTDDLGDRIHLVTVIQPGATEPLAAAPALRRSARWHLLTGDASILLGALLAGWHDWAQTDAGSTVEDFFRLPAIILVDQQGALRGFWRDDAAGRGNAINAARLLAEHGPRPGG